MFNNHSFPLSSRCRSWFLKYLFCISGQMVVLCCAFIVWWLAHTWPHDKYSSCGNKEHLDTSLNVLKVWTRPLWGNHWELHLCPFLSCFLSVVCIRHSSTHKFSIGPCSAHNMKACLELGFSWNSSWTDLNHPRKAIWSLPSQLWGQWLLAAGSCLYSICEQGWALLFSKQESDTDLPHLLWNRRIASVLLANSLEKKKEKPLLSPTEVKFESLLQRPPHYIDFPSSPLLVFYTANENSWKEAMFANTDWITVLTWKGWDVAGPVPIVLFFGTFSILNSNTLLTSVSY